MKKVIDFALTVISIISDVLVLIFCIFGFALLIGPQEEFMPLSHFTLSVICWIVAVLLWLIAKWVYSVQERRNQNQAKFPDNTSAD